MKKTRIFIGLIAFMTLACSKVPDYVIPPDDMAKVMADMTIAETVVEGNYRNYQSDSAKMLLKQSVLAQYGYTTTDLDTSLMWYGGNLAKYSEVYDQAVKILEKKISDAGAERLLLEGELSGDSVNMWDKTSFMIFRPTLASNILKFEYPASEDWNQGDQFVLRAKYAGLTEAIQAIVTAQYADSTFELLNYTFSGNGWHDIAFYSDSLKMTKGINGVINFNDDNRTIVLDSIQLIRKPLDAKKYSQRYRQRRYDFAEKRKISRHKEDNESDSIG